MIICSIALRRKRAFCNSGAVLHPGASWRIHPSMAVRTFKQVKTQKARSRMAAARKARRSPQAAAALQRRASLVRRGANWRITNLNEVARAIAKSA
jgi:hypothetical protein